MIPSILDNSKLERLGHMIDGAAHIVITCHISPDGDAIGSSLAFRHVLRQLGKDAEVVVPDMPPRTLAFLPGMRDITVFTKAELRARYFIENADLLLCLDFNALHRLDKMAQPFIDSQAPKVLIDHHEQPEHGFDLEISHPEMSSTCELVFRIFFQQHLLNYVDRHAAQCLYTGLMTDTGNFTYNCEDPALYEIQAVLMRRGINKQMLYSLAMNTFSANALRLQGHAIANMQIFEEQGAALLSLGKEDLERFNYHKGDTEGLVNKPLSVPGIIWSIFLREDTEKGKVKVSCRSRGDFNVSDICAKHFGGGGHINAAGGDFYGTIQEARQEACRLINLYLPDNQSKTQ